MQYQEHMKKLREKFSEMKDQIDKMEKSKIQFFIIIKINGI